MKKIILLFILMLGISALGKNLRTENEFKRIIGEISQVTKELQTAWDTKNEEALRSSNIEKKTEPLAEKISSFINKNPDYKNSFHEKVSVFNELLDKINSQHAKDLPKAREEAISALKKAASSLQKKSLSVISYDEWFTLTKVGAEAGKKYSFIACFDGERNMTTIPKIESYTSRNLCVGGKKLFYSTDLVKDKTMHIKMTNVTAEILCVTAFISGNESQIYSVENQSYCNY